MKDSLGLEIDTLESQDIDALGLVRDIPAETPVKTWGEVQTLISPHTTPQEQTKVRNAMAISATHDLDFEVAYDTEPEFTKKLNKPNFFDYAGKSFVAGVGDMYVNLANVFKWAQIPTGRIGQDWEYYGKKMQNIYIPPDDKPFSYDKLLSPEFYATSVMRSVPSTLSLIPAALIGAELGIGAGTVILGRALGAFTKTILGSIGAAALSRPLESAMEASGTYQQAIDSGMPEDEARRAANETFKGNMSLVGLDAAEFAMAFTPMKFNTNILALRILSTLGKVGGVAAMEGAEERYQQIVQEMAVNPEAKISDFFTNNPNLNEATAIGAIFGVGLGGAGSVYTAFTNRIVKGFTPETKALFDSLVEDKKAEGLTSEEATKKVLDEIASTPEGEKEIKDSVEKIKEDAQDITSKAEVDLITEGVKPPLEVTPKAEDVTEADITEFVESETGISEEQRLNKMTSVRQELAYQQFLLSGSKDTFDGFVKQFGNSIFNPNTGEPVEISFEQPEEQLEDQGYSKEQAEFILRKRQDMLDIKSPTVQDIVANPSKYTPIEGTGEITIYRVAEKGEVLIPGKFVFTSKEDAIAFRDKFGYERGQPEIIEQKVNKKNLRNSPENDPSELIYFPEEQSEEKQIKIYDESEINPDELPWTGDMPAGRDYLSLVSGEGKLSKTKIVDVNDIESTEKVSREQVDELKEYIKDTNNDLPPIVVERDASGFFVVDGHNRFQAAKELGYTKIPVREYESPAEPEEQLQKAPAETVQTMIGLIKKYVEEIGEKVNTQEDIEKVKSKYPEEFQKIEAEEKIRQKLWNKLPESFRKNRGINEYSNSELQAMVSELPSEFKVVTPETQGVKNIKQRIRQTTGQVTLANMIREDKALEAAFKKAQQAARAAFRAGNKEGVEAEKVKMENLLSRAKKIKAVQEFFGLTYANMKTVSRKNPFLMSQYEFKLYLDDVRQKAFEKTIVKNAKIALKELIRTRNLQKVENLQRALKYPSIDKMDLDQLNNFFDILDQYKKDDVFLSERRLEVVDRTDLKGIKTWREAKEAFAKEAGISVEELGDITVSQFDKYRYDTALMQRNPFYKMLVTEIHREMMNAEMRHHDVKLEAYRLAKAAEASRPQPLIHKFIPQNKLIMGYIEAAADQKTLFLNQMTSEEIDYAHFIEEYFENALEYLVETQSLTKGRENYFVHMRQGFLENIKEEGLLTAVKNIFKHYKEDEVVFNILDEDTGNILPLEKFFQFSLHRTGGLLPTSNVTEAFLAYSKMFERKASFDKIIPKLDIYAQALTPQKLTPHGLEMDRSLKKFLNQYINNKKGRHIDQFVGKQGGAVDMGLRAVRSFTSLLDLGLNIPVGITAFVGEQVTNFAQLGINNMAKGAQRAFTPHGKAIVSKYEAWLGRSAWESLSEPGKGITEKIHEGLFIGFHESTRIANTNFLLGMITEQEFNSETITDKRLAELQLEMGRMRVVPASKSLVGSTSLGSVLTQYKTWAIPIMSTIKGDISTFITDLQSKPFNEVLTTKEARELYRIVGLSSAIIITGAVLAGDDDENDTSFLGAFKRKFYRESLSLIGALDPTLYTPIRALSFMTDLAKNLKAIALLETYKTKPKLKGVEGLKKQLTPKAVKQFIPEEKKFKH